MRSHRFTPAGSYGHGLVLVHDMGLIVRKRSHIGFRIGRSHPVECPEGLPRSTCQSIPVRTSKIRCSHYERRVVGFFGRGPKTFVGPNALVGLGLPKVGNSQRSPTMPKRPFSLKSFISDRVRWPHTSKGLSISGPNWGPLIESCPGSNLGSIVCWSLNVAITRTMSLTALLWSQV